MRGLRRRRDERGAAAVEFGLISVIFLTLIIGVIQFSVWFWAYQVGGHAAREGARVGAVEPCADGPAVTRTTDRVGSAANGSPAVTVSRNDSDGNAGLTVGDEITVNVTYPVHSFGPFAGVIPGVDKSATARIEHIPAGGC